MNGCLQRADCAVTSWWRLFVHFFYHHPATIDYSPAYTDGIFMTAISFSLSLVTSIEIYGLIVRSAAVATAWSKLYLFFDSSSCGVVRWRGDRNNVAAAAHGWCVVRGRKSRESTVFFWHGARVFKKWLRLCWGCESTPMTTLKPIKSFLWSRLLRY
jgi:hypothetical protein